MISDEILNKVTAKEDASPTEGAKPAEGTKFVESTSPAENTKPTKGAWDFITEGTKLTEGTKSSETAEPSENDATELQEEPAEKKDETPAEKSGAKQAEGAGTGVPTEFLKEAERLRKRVEDTQAYAHTINQANKRAEKLINELLDSADIDEDVAERFRETLKHDARAIEEEIEERKVSPLDEYNSVITHDLFNSYIEISDDTKAEAKLAAFNALTGRLSEKEALKYKKKMDEVSEGKPAKLLKCMLEIGDAYLNAGYGKYLEHGGDVVSLISSYEAINKEKDDKIARLEAKLSKIPARKNSVSTGTQWPGSQATASHPLMDTNKGPFETMFERVHGS